MTNKNSKLYQEMYGILPEKSKNRIRKGFRKDLEIRSQIEEDNLYAIEVKLCANKMYKKLEIGRLIR
jgi:hypothetical protein